MVVKIIWTNHPHDTQAALLTHNHSPALRILIQYCILAYISMNHFLALVYTMNLHLSSFINLLQVLMVQGLVMHGPHLVYPWAAVDTVWI